MIKNQLKIALIGNPNSGKTSLFNQLTGLNQKVGNFPGVTVDKKFGFLQNSNLNAEIIDLPGTYSLHPKSPDEQVVIDILLDKNNVDYPDICIVTVDASHLKKHLLLLTQVLDLKIPVVLVLNMIDEVNKNGIEINFKEFESFFGVPIIGVNSRNGEGVKELTELLQSKLLASKKTFYELNEEHKTLLQAFPEIEANSDFSKLLILQQHNHLDWLSEKSKANISDKLNDIQYDTNLKQVEETLTRYNKISKIIAKAYIKSTALTNDVLSNKLDKILTHKIWGYFIFFTTLFLLFQAIFTWASYPMDLIDLGISSLNGYLSNLLPNGPFSNLLTEGVISGIGGIIIFIPQIAILFFFIAILEETGYMARVTFIMDKLMRSVGLNGRSVVPLVSSIACAVPAIMSARTIDNYKDRLITIFIAPFISCSARIPVYTIIISLVIPEEYIFGFINLQGLVMLAMYLVGFFAAFLTAFVMKWFMNRNNTGYFILELPVYRLPRWQNVGITIVEKVKTFVFSAGKIILAISIILWVLASYGGTKKTEQTIKELTVELKNDKINKEDYETQIKAIRLENSYAGQFGKFIEPSIKPLGFDWKIGIALITSFAAREVFVSTMATIFSINSDDEETLISKMRTAKNPDGTPYFNLPVGMSLLVFYALAMQCMSTLAIVKRETKSWLMPTIQMFYMSGLAYVCSFIVYQLLS